MFKQLISVLGDAHRPWEARLAGWRVLSQVFIHVKYLNNVAEQDHRGVKRVTRPMLGFTSLEAAQGTRAGLARMPMIKKQHMRVGAEDAGRTAAEQFDALASSSPHRQDRVASNRPHTHTCDNNPQTRDAADGGTRAIPALVAATMTMLQHPSHWRCRPSVLHADSSMQPLPHSRMP